MGRPPERGSHLAKPWEAMSPVGVKQGADDPFHTDWMLGAGLGVRDMHPSGGFAFQAELSAAAHDARSAVEKRLLGFACSVLLPGPTVSGVALHPVAPGEVDWAAAEGERPVLVLRDASPGWLPDVLRALSSGGAVIVGRGGSMAHLITEVRPSGKGPLVRMPDALRLYPAGALVRVSAAEGRIGLIEQPWTPRAQGPSRFDLPRRPGTALRTRRPPASGSPFGLSVHAGPGPSPEKRYRHMETACRLVGRDHRAHASWHWDDTGAGDREVRMLSVHVRRKDGHGGATVCSVPRAWKDGEEMKAVADALYMVSPSERPDSPETNAVRQEAEDALHAWWQRGKESMDDAALVEAAREEIRSRDAMGAGGTWRSGDADDMSAHDDSLRHYDIEFTRRGMTHRVGELECVDAVVKTRF